MQVSLLHPLNLMPEPYISSCSKKLTVQGEFERLVGVPYNASNFIDRWIYELLQKAKENNLSNLEKYLSVISCLHPDNQKAILSSAYNLAKQENIESNCCLLETLLTKNELTNNPALKFDFKKEENIEGFIGLSTFGKFYHRLVALFAATCFLGVGVCRLLNGYPRTCTLMYKNIYNQIELDELLKNCKPSTEEQIFDYVGIPLVISTYVLVGVISYHFKQIFQEIDREKKQTFEDFALRSITKL